MVALRALDELRELFRCHRDVISRHCTENAIYLKRIPACSPQFGGLWEVAVNASKFHLNRVLGQAYLTEEEFFSLIAEIEAILNSRPLTHMSSNANEEDVLTSGHFFDRRYPC